MPSALVDHLASLVDPTAETVFRTFARWCADADPSARAWLSLSHPFTDGEPTRSGWPLQVGLVLEGPGGVVLGAVTLSFPLPDEVRARMDAPSARVAWAEEPRRADRLWATFRRATSDALVRYSPRVATGAPE